VGIDLGTTNSVVAYLDDTGRPQTLTNMEGDNTTPSVVLFDDGDVIVGKEAIKAMATDMERVAESVKRELGHQVFHKSLQGQSYPPETLQAWILNKIRNDAAKTIGPFDKVVITVPAYFDEVRRKATQDAGYMAGFQMVDIINEPTAAAIAAGFQEGYLRPEAEAGEAKIVLVYDLGGGTFDVTLMRIGGGEYTTLATDGDVRLGGRDWDQRLVDFVAEEFVRNYGIDPREDPNSLGRLLRECEDAKRTLSARSRACCWSEAQRGCRP
jgi:molecular chaperone DnaK